MGEFSFMDEASAQHALTGTVRIVVLPPESMYERVQRMMREAIERGPVTYQSPAPVRLDLPRMDLRFRDCSSWRDPNEEHTDEA